MNKSCPACSRECPLEADLCPHCHAPFTGGEETAAAGPPTSRPDAEERAAFATGDVLAGRYRIVSLLGRGAMGEVYRAFDARLEQDVALKLLPHRFAADPERLARFRDEVRTARQVSHPNVCRVYDLGEDQGHVFLTMEFVPGDDLRLLLRRVGRLPKEKAVEVARQLCAAVAAVHDQGLLHRDLKPANVLIDTEGKVRLVDFGIAALAGRVADVRSGTAAYQAPEVLAGRQVTAQSDLFALGLVLYEVFTGKQAFPARGLGELTRMHGTGPQPPSEHVRDLEPAVERVLLRCLKSDPDERPRSAAEIQAALPGALQAVVAEGQTPTPGFVADAGGIGSVPSWLGRALLASVVLGIVLLAWLTDLAGLHRRVPLRDPKYLRGTAADLAKQLRYPARDAADGILVDHRALDPAPRPEQWPDLKEGRPAALFYWYRRSGRGRLVHRLSPNDILGYGIPGMVGVSEPPYGPGEVCVLLDGDGRLIELHARPDGDFATTKADWKPLFDAAKLEQDRLEPAEPSRDPGAFVDERAAWSGPAPNSPDRKLFVEAAACGGRPVYFRVSETKTADDRATMSDLPPDRGTQLSEAVYAVVRLLALTVGAWMAWRNVRQGVANRTGATRLATYYVVAYLISWLFMAHHTTTPADEWAILAAALGVAVANALTLWVIYLALEPLVRRHHPEWMIGWNRLLDGRWRDPAVGRDVLIGAAFGVAWAILLPIRRTILPEALGLPYVPYPVWTAALTDGPPGPLSGYAYYPLFFRLLEFFTLVIVYFVSGRPAAIGACGLFWTMRTALDLSGPVFGVPAGVTAISLAAAALATALALVSLLRFGLLAFVAFGVFAYALTELPISLDPHAPYAASGLVTMAVLAGLAAFAFRRATAGRGEAGGVERG